jgi:hypothetical protein
MLATYWKHLLTLQRPGAVLFVHSTSKLVTLLFCSSKPPCYPPTRSLSLVNLNVEEAPYVNYFCPCQGPVSCNLTWLSTTTPTTTSSHRLLPLLALIALILPLIVYAGLKIKKAHCKPAIGFVMESGVYRITMLPDHYDRISIVSRGCLSTASANTCNIDSSTGIPTEHLTQKDLLTPAVVEQNPYINTGLVMTESPAYKSLRNLQADGSTTSNCAGAASSPENSTLPHSEVVTASRECQTKPDCSDHDVYLYIKCNCTPEQTINLPNTVAEQ